MQLAPANVNPMAGRHELNESDAPLDALNAGMV
jgi:hypothetical protein